MIAWLSRRSDDRGNATHLAIGGGASPTTCAREFLRMLAESAANTFAGVARAEQVSRLCARRWNPLRHEPISEASHS